MKHRVYFSIIAHTKHTVSIKTQLLLCSAAVCYLTKPQLGCVCCNGPRMHMMRYYYTDSEQSIPRDQTM